VGFEPTISAGERLQNYVLDRAATGTGYNIHCGLLIYIYMYVCVCVCVCACSIISLHPSICDHLKLLNNGPRVAETCSRLSANNYVHVK